MSQYLPYLQALLPQTPGLLPKWMLIVAVTAVFNSCQNFVTISLTRRVYNAKSGQVTPLQARSFAAWTFTSAIIRFYAAYNMQNKACYDMALLSYLVAFAHFSSELFIFGTAKLFPGAISPVIVSTTSLVWMISQYGYYIQP